MHMQKKSHFITVVILQLVGSRFTDTHCNITKGPPKAAVFLTYEKINKNFCACWFTIPQQQRKFSPWTTETPLLSYISSQSGLYLSPSAAQKEFLLVFAVTTTTRKGKACLSALLFFFLSLPPPQPDSCSLPLTLTFPSLISEFGLKLCLILLTVPCLLYLAYVRCVGWFLQNYSVLLKHYSLHNPYCSQDSFAVRSALYFSNQPGMTLIFSCQRKEMPISLLITFFQLIITIMNNICNYWLSTGHHTFEKSAIFFSLIKLFKRV